MRRFAARTSIATVLGLLGLAGCGGGGDDGGGDCDPIAATLVSRIEVTPPTASVADGESVQLAAKAFSCDGSLLATPTFTWQSSDATTVSVNTVGMAVGVKLGGPVAIKATAQGKEGAAQVSVVPRSVESVRIEPATANVAVGRTSTLVAKAFDAQGNELPDRSATWTSEDEAIVTVAQTGAITGVVAGGPVTVTATIEGHSGSAEVTVVDAAVATVTVTPATTNVPSGSTVQLTAVLRDDQGNVLTGRAVLWTTSDPARASVSTTGVVTGLALGGPVTILATSEGRSGSSAVTVVPGAAARLAFIAQPSDAVAGVPISPDIKVEVRDAAGNRVPGSTATVTMTIETNPAGGPLAGTRVVNAVAGVATFSNLRINRPGNGYTLNAASPGLTAAISSSFSVVAGLPTSMRFSVQPSDVQAGVGITPDIRVELLDDQLNVATGATPVVSLSLANNPGGATLSGTTSVAAVAGVATFGGISLNAIGSGYTLAAASASLPAVNSSAFSVTPGLPATIAFTVQPSDAVAGSSIDPPVQVEIRDAFGNLVTTPTEVTLSLGDNPGGATLGGTLTVSSGQGVAVFGAVTLDRVGSGYTLVANAAGLGATSTPFSVSPGPAASLRFLVGPPASAGIFEVLAPPIQVELLDASGNRATSSSLTVSIGKLGPGSNNRLQGDRTKTAQDGVATFNDLRFSTPGTYQLTASGSQVTSDTSSAIVIGL